MPADKTGSCRREGASSRRGAQHPYNNYSTINNTPIATDSLRRLRQSINERRQAQGQEAIQVSFDTPPQHELTEEEVERKERRKRQNREAARKCRMKKKEQQHSAMTDHDRLREANRKLREEVRVLRQWKAALEKALQDHVQCGLCLFLGGGTSDFMPVPSTPSVASSSLQPASSTATISITTTTQPQPSAPPANDFADLPDLNLPSIDLLEEFLNLGGDSIDNIPSEQPPLLFPDNSLMESLNNLMATGPQISCASNALCAPISPATGHDRRSVASEASEMSVLLEHSQGFEVPNLGGSATLDNGVSHEAAQASGRALAPPYNGHLSRAPEAFNLPNMDALGDDDHMDDEVFEGPAEELFKDYLG